MHKLKTSSLHKIPCASGVYKAERRQSKRIPRFIVRHAVKDEEENYREFKNTLLNPKECDCIFL